MLPEFVLVFIVSLKRWIGKSFREDMSVFDEYMKIEQGRCMGCGEYSPENVERDSFWISLTCSHCKKRSVIHKGKDCRSRTH
jgi:hypothetical protein